jgi:hypothetical protein
MNKRELTYFLESFDNAPLFIKRSLWYDLIYMELKKIQQKKQKEARNKNEIQMP